MVRVVVCEGFRGPKEIYAARSVGVQPCITQNEAGSRFRGPVCWVARPCERHRARAIKGLMVPSTVSKLAMVCGFLGFDGFVPANLGVGQGMGAYEIERAWETAR